MVVFLRTIIVSLTSFLILISLTAPAASKELVGITPFANQRDHQGSNWLGFYFQSELQRYLSEGMECGFHSLNTLRLWQFKAKSHELISPETTVLITGSFQEVLDLGFIEINVHRFGDKTREERFEISYDDSNLETNLPLLFGKVAKWIDPSFAVADSYTTLPRKVGFVKEVFEFREQLYLPGKIPDVGRVLRLNEKLKNYEESRFVADLAEGMIILSKELPAAEGKVLQQKAEALLRKMSIKHINDSRLTALLAEVYYVGGKEVDWVRQTSEQALKLDEFNDLALLMMLLSLEPGQETSGLKEKMNRVNPWIWPELTPGESSIRFQKGIFDMELIGINEITE